MYVLPKCDFRITDRLWLADSQITPTSAPGMQPRCTQVSNTTSPPSYCFAAAPMTRHHQLPDKPRPPRFQNATSSLTTALEAVRAGCQVYIFDTHPSWSARSLRARRRHSGLRPETPCCCWFALSLEFVALNLELASVVRPLPRIFCSGSCALMGASRRRREAGEVGRPSGMPESRLLGHLRPAAWRRGTGVCWVSSSPRSGPAWVAL